MIPQNDFLNFINLENRNDQELMCVSKMNGPTRLKLYLIIAKRDGEFCKCCQALKKEKQLVLDHVDNDNANNQLNNLQLLCRSCNYLKNPRGRPVDLCVSEGDASDTSELKVNRMKEPLFRKYVFDEITESKVIPEKELINSGAEHVGVSQVTCHRYLNKLCSKFGLFEKIMIGNTLSVRFKKELILT